MLSRNSANRSENRESLRTFSNRARLLYRPAHEDRLGNATVNNAQEDIDSYAKPLGCVW